MSPNGSAGPSSSSPDGAPVAKTPLVVILAVWAVVAVPLAYGVSQTLLKAAKLFAG
jgi:hypothetical protein